MSRFIANAVVRELPVVGSFFKYTGSEARHDAAKCMLSVAAAVGFMVSMSSDNKPIEEKVAQATLEAGAMLLTMSAARAAYNLVKGTGEFLYAYCNARSAEQNTDTEMQPLSVGDRSARGEMPPASNRLSPNPNTTT